MNKTAQGDKKPGQGGDAPTKAELKKQKTKVQNVLTEVQQNEIKKAFDYFDITGSGEHCHASFSLTTFKEQLKRKTSRLSLEHLALIPPTKKLTI